MRLEELGLGSEATAARNTKPVDRGCKLTVKKIYAVGLEMVCPGGACDWAPEIPSGLGLAGFAPSKYEPVHKWWTFLADRAWPYARRSSAETLRPSNNPSRPGSGRAGTACPLDQPCLDSGSLTGTWGDVLTMRGAPSA